MEDMAVSQELKPKYVTQEEASAVVELWARLDSNRSRANLLTIADLSESLQISEADAERLLHQVRSQGPATTAQATSEPQDFAAVTVFGIFCLALSFLTAAVFMYLWLTHSYNRDERSEYMTMGMAVAWCAGWAWYFRRPIKRAITGFFRGKA